MHPVLFQVGSITLYAYGFFIALGYLACLSTSVHLGKKEGFSPAVIADLAFYLLVTGFVGARLLFVITRWEDYAAAPLDIFKIWEGGLVFFGGLLGATTFCLWYLRRHQLPAWRVMDIGGISVPLAHAFGRIGCFFAGCCHGSACELPWAVRLHSDHVQENLRGVPIHPVQLYETFALFALVAFLYWLWQRRKFTGQIVLLYFMIYSVIRSVVEIYRGDSIRGFVIDGWISTSQFISILVLLGAGALYFKRSRESNA